MKGDGTSWPGSPLDRTMRYRAVLAGLTYELAPARRPGQWWARVKRGRRVVKRMWDPMREDALLRLFGHFFPVGLQLSPIKRRRPNK